MEKHKFTIKKVPLFVFLNLLNNLYADGADFIDLHGEIDGTGLKDNVSISVPLEYLSKESREENFSPPPEGIEEEEYDDDNENNEVLTEKEITNLLKNI